MSEAKKTKKFNLFFSQTASDLYGYNIYLTEDGREVKVTAALDHLENPNDNDYGYNDKIFQGVGSKWLRSVNIKNKNNKYTDFDNIIKKW